MSPALNPIEEVFGVWKKYVSKEIFVNRSKNLLFSVLNAGDKLKKLKFRNFFHHFIENLCKSLENADL